MFHLQILTPEEIFFDDDIMSLVIPGTAGYLGILQDHTPLMTSLKPGVITITDKNNKNLYYKVEEGFFEVKMNQAVLLVEVIETASEIEVNKSI